MMDSFNFKIGGSAGEGIKKTGQIFLKTCFNQGLYAHGYIEYPSLIRGGHNTFQVHASTKPILSPKIKLDLLVALNQESVDLHQSELTDNSIVLFDQINWLGLTKKLKANPQMKNMATLGASCFLLGLSLENLNQAITSTFSKKDPKIINLNRKLAKLGFKTAQNKLKSQARPLLANQTLQNQTVMTGNHALSLGAIAGGMKLYAAYPMTPATSILHILAKLSKKANITVRHVEDEIGSINMAIGAGFAGVRSMVATSGGGFSLMTEGLGLAGVTETPVVIVNAMRPGPASGMPTWSGQGDLLYAINASQDEFPRIVLTPGDPLEAFNLSKLAQNLAEKYQLPVIILTDKYLGESYFTFNKFKTKHQNQRFGFASTKNLNNQESFKRYQDTQTGVSPRTIPGKPGGVHLCNSYEHNELGLATEESDQRNLQVKKRAKKITTILNSQDFPQPELHGPKTTQHTLISWGSNKGVIIDTLSRLKNTNFIHFPAVWPFPKKSFLKLYKSVKNPITLECNHNAQLNQLISQTCQIKIKNKLLKFDGRPFYPQEIIDYVQKNHSH